MLEEQIRELIRRYLAHEIDRSAFAQHFGGLYFEVRRNPNTCIEARRLCNSIVLPFAELSRGHRSEESFRQVLLNVSRPFALDGDRLIRDQPDSHPMWLYRARIETAAVGESIGMWSPPKKSSVTFRLGRRRPVSFAA